MRTLAVVSFALCLGFAATAHADGDLAKTIDLALENYDLGEYKAAKSQLEGALDGVAGDAAIIARGHLALAAVYVKLGNEAGAKASLSRALDADDSVRPEPRYAHDALMALFDTAAAERKAATSCDGIAAVAHERGKPAESGKPYTLTCLAGNQLGDISVSVFYRTADDQKYSKLAMEKTGECSWSAKIPPVSGEQLEYHFAAANKAGKTVAAHGSAGSPNSVVVESGAKEPPKGRRAEDEVPDELGGQPPKPRAKGCAGCSGGSAGGSAMSLLFVCALLAGLRRNRLQG